MFRSLYSGVSGLTANLVEIDVIGNNIANSNTIGFKSGRVTFSEMLTQNLRSASRPISGGRGGTNPQQIGLGTIVGSIDSNFNQGNFRTTGIKTDLAIQGPGFFILNDGLTKSYTRAGAFGLDSNHYLVDPSTGHILQGVMANASGEISTGTMEDLFIDTTNVMPAQASSSVELLGNLDADSDAMETVLQSDVFLVAAGGGDELIGLHGQEGVSFDLRLGDLISVSGMVGGTPLTISPFLVGGDPANDGGTTYQHLVAWLGDVFAGEGYNVEFNIDASGALRVTNNEGAGSAITNLALSIGGRVEFNQNFQFPPSIDGGTSALTSDSSPEKGEIRAPAEASDLFTELYGVDGKHLGLDLSGGFSTLEIQGTRGGEAITRHTMQVDATTTVADFLTQLQVAFRMSASPVIINDDGQIIMRGDVGTSNAIGNVSIRELLGPGSSNDIIETSFHFLETQAARDEQSFSVATSIYDSLGTAHSLTFTFKKEFGLNEWIWEANTEGNEDIMLGGSGRARFTENGAIASFTFDDGSSTLTFRPQPVDMDGADLVSLNVDFGTIGSLDGLTQFDASGSLQAMADGFTSGNLVDFEIDQNGLVIGHYSNDTVRNLARIGIAMFSNPGGLSRSSNNAYRRTGNSGQPIDTFPGENHGTTLVSGTLEASNVDLAEQFTRLVVAQRAFQANARVITAGDQLLQELVSILR